MDNYILREISKESIYEVFGYSWDGGDIAQLLNKDLLKKLGLISAIIYCYDMIITDKVEDLDIDWDNIMEARIFDDIHELKLWRYDNEIRGTIFKENNATSSIKEEFILYPRKKEGYNPTKLIVNKYIEYDEDGQAYIAYVRPSILI